MTESPHPQVVQKNILLDEVMVNSSFEPEGRSGSLSVDELAACSDVISISPSAML